MTSEQSVSVLLPDDAYHVLHALAASHGCSMGDILRAGWLAFWRSQRASQRYMLGEAGRLAYGSSGQQPAATSRRSR